MNPFIWIKKQSIFNDVRATWLLAANLALSLWNVAFMLLAIESRPFKVPVRYSGYLGNISDQEEWIALFALPLFVVISFVITAILSIKIHSMRPPLAHTLLGLGLLVGAFTFLVARSLLGLF
jgi:hypothetical protein